MSHLLPRLVETIDEDLRSCREIWRNAAIELAEVRRRQHELMELEATLLATIDMRRWTADRLLDERLSTVTQTDRVGLTGVTA